MAVQLRTTLRFLFWLGLLLFEVILAVAFYVVPQFQSHEFNAHPNIGLEMDAVLQKYPKASAQVKATVQAEQKRVRC